MRTVSDVGNSKTNKSLSALRPRNTKYFGTNFPNRTTCEMSIGGRVTPRPSFICSESPPSSVPRCPECRPMPLPPKDNDTRERCSPSTTPNCGSAPHRLSPGRARRALSALQSSPIQSSPLRSASPHRHDQARGAQRSSTRGGGGLNNVVPCEPRAASVRRRLMKLDRLFRLPGKQNGRCLAVVE